MFAINDYLRDLETLVNMDSNSYDPQGLNRNVDKLTEIAKRFGLYVKRHPMPPETGDYLEISNRESPEHYDVIMIGHIDTVLPTGTAAQRPYSEDQDFVYGPGAADMKSGTLAMLYIAKELSKEVNDKLSIGILMNCDEEITSRYSRNLTREIAKRADYAFVMEAAGKAGKAHTIRRKGSGTYKITFHGIPGHSGYILEKPFANAVVEMARWATALHGLNNPETNLSVNIASAHGGSAANVVPDHAEMTVNIRVVEKSQYTFFEETLKTLAASPVIAGVTTEVEIVSKRQPMVPVPEMEAYLPRVRKVFESVGQTFSLHPLRGGCSDGNEIADVGVLCIDTLGPHAADGHTDHEYVYKDDIEPCIRRMVALIEEIASQK